MRKKDIIILVFVFCIAVMAGSVLGARLLLSEGYSNEELADDEERPQEVSANDVGNQLEESSEVPQIYDELYMKQISNDMLVREGDICYVDSQILVYLQDNTDRDKLVKWVAKDDGVIVGEISLSNTYQIEYPGRKSLQELEKIIAELEKKDEIAYAVIHYASYIEPERIAYTEESWSATSDNHPETPFKESGTVWNTELPDGANWWAEAIGLPQIESLDLDLNPVKVGVIDEAFDTHHPDLRNAFKKVYENPDQVDQAGEDIFSHGTHVAGLIGARVNGSGIAGVHPTAELYGFSYSGKPEHRYLSLLQTQYAIASMLKAGVKVINMSFGDLKLTQAVVHKLRNENRMQDGLGFLEEYDKLSASFELFVRLCKEQYEFMLIKAAGNSHTVEIVNASEEDEADDNVLTIAGYRQYDPKRDRDGTFESVSGVSCRDSIYYINDEDVRDSILYVGAMDRIDKSGIFHAAKFSCSDADIMAPGVDILSDLPNENIGFKSGTSMAAPIVAGTAALVWSINPSLTAEQVRIILLSANRPFAAVKKNRTVVSEESLLNAYYAVSLAVDTLADPMAEGAIQKPKEERATYMGVLYEDIGNGSHVNVENAQDLVLTVTDNKELYQRSVPYLEGQGGFYFFMYPGEYTLTVSSSYYDTYTKTISVKAGDVIYDEIGLSREGIRKNLYNRFLSSQSTYYGSSYEYTMSRSSAGVFNSTTEGLETGLILGYAVDDFDSDNASELLIMRADDEMGIEFEMYTLVGNEVIMTDSFVPVADSAYGQISMPMASSRSGNDCALVSCFVEEKSHVIFLQVSDHGGAFADGSETSILSVRYENGSFYDAKTIHEIGSSVEDSYVMNNITLLSLGVPYPDFPSIFETMKPLYLCFDDGIYEICHATQRSIDVVFDEKGWLSFIRSKTVFLDREDLYTKKYERKLEKHLSDEEQEKIYENVIAAYDAKMMAGQANEAYQDRTTFFCIADVDGDGVNELLLDFESDRNYYIASGAFGNEGDCFAMYTIKNGKPVAVIESANEGAYVPQQTKTPSFYSIYPGLALVEVYTELSEYDWRSEFYIYRNGVIANTPLFTIMRSGDNTYIDDYWVDIETFRSLDTYLRNNNCYLRILDETKYIPAHE